MKKGYDIQSYNNQSPAINLKINPKIFNDVYLPYLTDYSHRTEVYYGGRGSGKSIFIAQKLLIKALSLSELDKKRILILRKYGTTIKDSVFATFLDILTDWKLISHCKVTFSSYRIELPNGALLVFKSADSEKLKSLQGFSSAWLEESSEFTEEEYNTICLSIREGNNQQIFCSFNPTTKSNWTYRKWFSSDAVIDASTLIVHSTYKDNKFLPKPYVDTLEALIETNPYAYKVYVLGEWATLDKLVYQNWTVQEFDKNELIKQKRLETLVGLDWGYSNDVTAIVQSLLDEENKTIFICSEYYAKGMTNNDIADVLKYMGLSKCLIVADSAEPKSIAECKAMGISRIKPATKGKGSVNAGIDKLKQYKIVVHPNCANTVIELQNYSYQKDKQTGEYLNTPVDNWNHALDALRYSLDCVTSRAKVKSIPKHLFGF